jgi:hypothetical protein
MPTSQNGSLGTRNSAQEAEAIVQAAAVATADATKKRRSVAEGAEFVGGNIAHVTTAEAQLQK